MKYKYEFEADEYFEKGICYDCPLSYFDYGDDEYIPRCALHAHYSECPLEEVIEECYQHGDVYAINNDKTVGEKIGTCSILKGK